MIGGVVVAVFSEYGVELVVIFYFIVASKFDCVSVSNLVVFVYCLPVALGEYLVSCLPQSSFVDKSAGAESPFLSHI